MKKITVKASSDIALIKYWGKKDEVLRLPENGSISMILSGLDTVTTVEFDEKYTQDEVIIQGESEEGEAGRVVKHLDRIRKLARKEIYAKVVSNNTFPKGTGLSSSGSGFAALTIAATKAIGLNLNEKELSILARQGSGTACRCVCGGIVEWKDGETSNTSYSETIYPFDYFDVRDVVAVVDEGKKLVSSTAGHAIAGTSLFYKVRLQNIKDKIEKVRLAIKEKDFDRLGALVESETLEFHSILLTSKPAMIAWHPGTVEVMLEVQAMRRDGIRAYFTINTGFNVHVLTTPEFEDEVKTRLSKLSLVIKIITAKIGDKPMEQRTHLF
ncbi:MAG: diphosphomevalonate decarboxylase [Microgenomates group bacterium]